MDDPATAPAEGVPFKKLWMTQGTHGGGTSGAGYLPLVDAFWEKTLKGVDNGVEGGPAVHTVGRTAAGAGTEPRQEASWPPAGTSPLTLHLGRSFDTVPGLPPAGVATSTGEGGTLSLEPQDDGAGWTHADTGTVTEEAVLADPLNRGTKAGDQPVRSHGYTWLYHESEPLEQDLRIAGSAVLEAVVQSTAPGQHLTPILVEVTPDGKQHLVERGFLDLDYRNGLDRAEPATGQLVEASARMLPQDYTFSAGSRIGVVLMGSNTVWAVPGAAGALSYAMGPVEGVSDVGTRLVLPVVGDAPAPPPAEQPDEKKPKKPKKDEG